MKKCLSLRLYHTRKRLPDTLVKKDMINKHDIKHYNNCKFLENFFRLDFGYNQYSTSSIFMIFLKKLFKEIFSTHIL